MIVRAVLGLGRSLGMSVVAEGVETDAQMRFLAAEACDEAQVYLISKPQPIEHFAEQIGAAKASWHRAARTRPSPEARCGSTTARARTVDAGPDRAARSAGVPRRR